MIVNYPFDLFPFSIFLSRHRWFAVGRAGDGEEKTELSSKCDRFIFYFSEEREPAPEPIEYWKTSNFNHFT